VRLRRLYLRGAAALAGVAALLAIAEVLGGSFDSTDAKIFGTIATAFVGGSAVVAGLACFERGSLDGVTVVAVRGGGRRVVRIGEVEAPLASDESVVLRRS
jgi:hypothetical protein